MVDIIKTMPKIYTYLHATLTKEQLDQIIRIKSVAWPYSYESQVDWIEKNLKGDDVHVLLHDDQGKALAYLNLIRISIRLDNTPCSAFGIGNVCALEKGHGWGRDLMMGTNEFITAQNSLGLLFCKNNLVHFYTDCQWRLLESRQLNISTDQEIITMFYKPEGRTFEKLAYDGKLF
jgi:hypothetical protein